MATPSGILRSSVLMILPHHPTGQEWLKAARSVYPTVGLRLLSRSGVHRPTVHMHHDADGIRIDMHVPRLRPSRWVWRLNARLVAREIGRCLPVLKKHGYLIGLLHGHFYSHSAALPYIRSRYGVPYIVTEHSSALTLLNPSKRVSRAGYRLAYQTYRSAEFILPVSGFLAERIQDLGLPGPLRVVSNPIDLNVFFPTPRHALDSRRHDVRIVSVSSLIPVKRLDLLLAGFAGARLDCSRLKLTVVGSGPLRKALQDRARALGLEGAVSFIGSLDRPAVADTLRRSDFYVSASATENLPLAILEALACGLPVVAPNVGGVPELVNDDVGVLYPSGNIQALRDAILTMAHALPAPELRRQAVTQAETRSIERVAEHLAEIYSRVMDEALWTTDRP